MDRQSVRQRFAREPHHLLASSSICLCFSRSIRFDVRLSQMPFDDGVGRNNGRCDGEWDSHSELKPTIPARHANRSAHCRFAQDLKQRRLLRILLSSSVLEFGRSPGAEGTGRDHHPQGFCAWLAGRRHQRADSSMERPTNSAFTPSRIAITSRTSTRL